ncbi:hypothetical protein BLA29_005610, partial [Euroglyphus maynei]
MNDSKSKKSTKSKANQLMSSESTINNSTQSTDLTNVSLIDNKNVLINNNSQQQQISTLKPTN